MRIFAIVLVFASLSLLVAARFDQEEKPKDIKKLERFMSGDIGGFLADISGTCIDSLVAAAPPCSMQDQCDIIIDVANFLGGKRRNALIGIARRLVVSEKNTPENGLRSRRCNKAPRHKELRGLFPKQDPTGSAKTRQKPPFVPKKFTKIRKFVLKVRGKIIAPSTRRN